MAAGALRNDAFYGLSEEGVRIQEDGDSRDQRNRTDLSRELRLLQPPTGIRGVGLAGDVVSMEMRHERVQPPAP
jgi:hypothetical protein